MLPHEPFPLDADEMSDVRSGILDGCVYIQFGDDADPWCVFHADACEGHWHLHVKFRDRVIEKTLPAEKIEEQIVERLAAIKGSAIKAGVKKVMN